jgi:hypothetical protein
MLAAMASCEEKNREWLASGGVGQPPGFCYIVERRTEFFRLPFDVDYVGFAELTPSVFIDEYVRPHILPVIAECYAGAVGSARKVVMCAAPAKLVTPEVKRLPDGAKLKVRAVKSAFHLIFPDLVVDDDTAREVRRAVVLHAAPERIPLLFATGKRRDDERGVPKLGGSV